MNDESEDEIEINIHFESEVPAEDYMSFDDFDNIEERIIELMYRSYVGRALYSNLLNTIEETIYNTVLNESTQTDNFPKKDESVKINTINLLYKNHKKECSDTCSICTENYQNNDVINILDCKHDFHTKCISEWACYKTECPICRHPIPKK